ncbi:D-serine deaminase-like pyridoxal phosphate-dependent protein [Nocardiopsis sp. Huas11]|uniref:alanine racemase n=1 Tax=Nocardiopsis sp. Huas11 TaxID=2183912 RepID=UPI000EADDB9F|nr:alanine racemase [Nocardiopsis sp. Huas11]RKS10237.1 D-serine deaminase-like pyridoxal phosphate-dependent protein [Nocardiopsis sp. Huas11]
MSQRLTIPREHVDWRTKGLWWTGEPITLEEFAARRDPLFTGPFTWPLMVLRASALDRNIAALADFTARRGLLFAPHGKTSMAPALLQRQLDAGAWGITAATANQVLAYRRFGIARVLLANELLDARVLRVLAAELDRDHAFEFLFYADSAEGVAVAAQAAADARGGRPLRVLVERGTPGGRTGCRTREELLSVARAVAGAPGLELAGVAGYEGPIKDAEGVRAFVRDLVGDAAAIAAEHGMERPVLSVGGSAWFDVVAEEVGASPDVVPILRSGAYVAHDDGLYRRTTPYRRLPEGPDALAGALELWAQVTSTPEPGLAIAGMGRREANSDQGFPLPRVLRRADGSTAPATGMEVTGLNDHHAYLTVPPELDVRPGDLVSFGISHPCTAFDRWQVLPVVDDRDTVVDAVATYF